MQGARAEAPLLGMGVVSFCGVLQERLLKQQGNDCFKTCLNFDAQVLPEGRAGLAPGRAKPAAHQLNSLLAAPDPMLPPPVPQKDGRGKQCGEEGRGQSAATLALAPALEGGFSLTASEPARPRGRGRF